MIWAPSPVKIGLWCLQTPKWKRKDKEEMKLGRNYEERQRWRIQNAHIMEKSNGRCVLTSAWHHSTLYSLTNYSVCQLVFHKERGKWLCSSDKGKHPNHTNPPTPQFDTSSLLGVYVQFRVLFYSQTSDITQWNAETNPVPLPGLCSLLRYWGVSYFRAGWL